DSRIIINSTAKFYISISYQKDLLSIDTRIFTPSMDEATSSVDPENEDELQRAIEALTHDKTIIMIAHRLKTVRNADQILVLDNAHIVQRGTHAELIRQKGLYADFVSARQEAIGWKLAQ
ncbi:MAG: hypothetical protein E7F06_01825, partial [Lachnospiraceae bacterium]|nr:hypothetical protein [Lachnospiraceae bacterium]